MYFESLRHHRVVKVRVGAKRGEASRHTDTHGCKHTTAHTRFVLSPSLGFIPKFT